MKSNRFEKAILAWHATSHEAQDDGSQRGATMKKGPTRHKPSSMRAKVRQDLADFEEIPNIGPSIAADLRLIGFTSPADLPGSDPYAMYDDLCRKTGQRHDPCVIDTFIAAVRYMEGAPKTPWWKYTAERKRELANRKVRVHCSRDVAGPAQRRTARVGCRGGAPRGARTHDT